jgi:hypothetical protein
MLPNNAGVKKEVQKFDKLVDEINSTMVEESDFINGGLRKQVSSMSKYKGGSYCMNSWVLELSAACITKYLQRNKGVMKGQYDPNIHMQVLKMSTQKAQ